MEFIVSLLLVALPGMAAADSAAKQHFDIAAGDLITSLELLEKASGIELLYDASLLKDVGSQGVEGDLTPRAALAALLEGTGFGSQRPHVDREAAGQRHERFRCPSESRYRGSSSRIP